MAEAGIAMESEIFEIAKRAHREERIHFIICFFSSS